MYDVSQNSKNLLIMRCGKVYYKMK